MLIIQIALAIVLALLIWRFLPHIVAGAILLAFLALIVLLLALVWLNLKIVAEFVGLISAIAIVVGIPFFLRFKIEEKYPKMKSLFNGEPPYDTMSKQPFRLLMMAIFSISFAAVGVGVLYAVLSFVEQADKYINS